MQKLYTAFIVFLFVISENSDSVSVKEKIKQPEFFLMPIEDVFSISGRGTVATGIVERGMIKIGDSVVIIGLSDTIIKSKINGIQMFNQLTAEAKKGDNVGLLLSGISRSQISRGMVVCKPGTVKAYTEFKCQLSLATKADGGRSTPIANGYRPQFVFHTATISGEITLPTGKDQLQPGESATVSVKLITPVAMEKNMEFTIREGGRIVGSGKTTEIIK